MPILKQLRYLQSVQTEIPLHSAPEGLVSKMDSVHMCIILMAVEKSTDPGNSKEELELKE